MAQPIQPSEEPQSGPRLAKTPPLPSAPPTTGLGDGPSPRGGRPGKLFSISGREFLVINAFVIVIGAWLVSLPGVIGALVISVPVVLIGARRSLMAKPALSGAVAAFLGGVTGSMLFGHAAWVIRVLLGLAAGLLVVPLALFLLVLRWDRIHRRRASA